MKTILCLLVFSLPAITSADTIKKWVDDEGKVHYGNKKNTGNNKSAGSLEIRDTFDQQSYNEGIKRHNETKLIGDELEKDRILEEEKRKEEENKPVRYPPPSGRVIVVPPAIGYGSYPDHPSRPGHPVQLPVRKR